MNFVDAAIELLKEADAPVHVEELCRQAVERELLSRPGANPLRSMKGRLTSEWKKGDESRVVKVEDDVWALRDAAEAETEASERNGHRRGARAEAEVAQAEVEEAQVEAVEPAEAAPELSPEEQALAELYADEAEGTTPVAELSEYRDEHTADEDRAMLPEIRAERGRHKGRRDRDRDRERGGRRERRKRRGRENGREREGNRVDSAAEVERSEEAAAERPERAAPPRPTPPHLEVDRIREPLVAGAVAVLSSVPRGQTLPIRQLTQMMRKQRAFDGNPDQMWRLVKGVLVRDESQRRAAGLPPRVVHRGRDLFSLAIDPTADPLGAAEASLAAAASAVESAHREHLRERLGLLSTKMLERVAHVYLHATGWTKIDWIKRVDRSSYAIATAPDAAEPSLVGVRTGPEEVDRRGVGELRAGVVAKDLAGGLLISPCELSDEARAELARGEEPLEILCGERFLEALEHAGVGTVRRTMTFTVTDEDFFAAVLG